MNKAALIFSFFFLLFDCTIVQGQSDDDPYVLVTKMPEFPGGSDAMMDFITDNLDYPMAEKKANIQGTIMMQFIVERDGSLSEIKAIKSVDKGENLVKEATRVIKMMPKWKPGMQDLHTVRVYKNIPFYFVLAPQRNTHPQQTTTSHK